MVNKRPTKILIQDINKLHDFQRELDDLIIKYRPYVNTRDFLYCFKQYESIWMIGELFDRVGGTLEDVEAFLAEGREEAARDAEERANKGDEDSG